MTRPFLRWAGGKNWLIKHLNQFIPSKGYNNYHEPFLGGGSVFFYLQPSRRTYLSDLNEDLIKVYNTLKDDPESIIKTLKKYHNNAEFYYKIREERNLDPIKHAARFIYLNQTSFNGIYRVNLKGIYNVPFGYRKKDFLQIDLLRTVSLALKNTKIFCADFDYTRKNIRKGDLVFIDPPYTVSHNNNGFIKYNQNLFSLADQYRLSKYIDFIKSKDAFYILTNAAHDTILEIFEKGDKRIELKRANLIGGMNAIRGEVGEYLFTNVKNEN